MAKYRRGGDCDQRIDEYGGERSEIVERRHAFAYALHAAGLAEEADRHVGAEGKGGRGDFGIDGAEVSQLDEGAEARGGVGGAASDAGGHGEIF